MIQLQGEVYKPYYSFYSQTGAACLDLVHSSRAYTKRLTKFIPTARPFDVVFRSGPNSDQAIDQLVTQKVVCPTVERISYEGHTYLVYRYSPNFYLALLEKMAEYNSKNRRFEP